jgi:PAS domain S-box-containing protein
MTTSDANVSADGIADRRLRGVYEDAPCGYHSLDGDGMYLHVNHTELAWLGYSREEVVGRKSFADLLTPDSRKRFQERYPSFQQRGSSRGVEYDMVRKDGTVLPVLLNATAIYDADGRYLMSRTTLFDITERRRTEDALRKNAEMFSRVFRAGPAAIAITTRDNGRVIDANDSMLRLLGYEWGEIVGRTTYDLQIWPDARDRQRLLEELAGHGSVRDRECTMRAKGGRIITALFSAEMVDIAGEPCILSLLVDITDRKRAEEALRREKAFTDAVIDSLPGSFYVLDEAGNYLRGNSILSVITGLAPDQIPGASALHSIHEQDRPAVAAKIAEAFACGSAEIESRVTLPDGVCRHFLFTGRRMDLGGARFLVGTGIDITGRIEAEAALRESEQRCRAVIEAGNDCVWESDVEGISTYVSPHVREVLGYEPEEIVGKPMFAFMAPEEGRRVKSLFDTLAAERKPFRGIENVNVHKTGRDVPLETNGVPVFDADGELRGFRGTARDITERKRALGALHRAKEAAEAANRAKSEFLTNMSHEIRTPLTAILGYADIIADNSDPQLVHEAAETIKRNGQHLLQLISDILDLSKIEVARLEPSLTGCDPRHIVDEVAALMRVRMDAKGLGLSVEHAASVPSAMHTDPLRLRQILINLVGNAAKFTETGGVRIVTRLVDEETESPKLKIDVIDTGIGLEPAQIGMLFRPFTQLDGSTRRKFGGSGLGLAISKRLALMLGGDIAVTSRPGVGSTFSLTVDTGPLEATPAFDTPIDSVPVASLPAVPDRLDCRLLLAEDGPDNQRLVSFVLRKKGADVTVAENGQIAVDFALAARAAGKPFDLILMDMQMPLLDGYEAARRLRKAGFTGPIIALTAHAMPGDRQRCLDAGCDDYISKPIVPAQLVAQLVAHLAPTAISRPA